MNFYTYISKINSLDFEMATTEFRSSRPEVLCKKGVLRNFAKFIGKHLGQSLFFNKVAGLSPATLLKKRLWHRCFLAEHLWWLLLRLSLNGHQNFLIRLTQNVVLYC